MAPDLSAVLFTDTNMDRSIFPTKIPDWVPGVGGGPAPPPLWDNIFDYYDVQPSHEPLVVVDPDKGERLVSQAISVWTGLVSKKYKPVDFRKLARQGAYDNIHIAPRMRLPGPNTLYDVV
ncbi:MAG: hypothetical protein IH897_13870, partial [Planctomycetes bacterium]|nr:hypothetical protein [Planctomycetota bacterium]